MNCKNYNDYEILYMLNENEDASELLYQKYKPLILRIANKFIINYPNIGIDINDIIQEGILAVDKASKTYDDNSNASFLTYVCKCITNSLFNLVRKHNNKKNHILNSSISYNKDDKTYDNIVTKYNTNKNIEPINFILEKEYNKEIINKLSRYEKDVAICKTLGFTNIEIQEMLNTNKKAISNAISRIKYKFN